jgi:hypothetical protein
MLRSPSCHWWTEHQLLLCVLGTLSAKVCMCIQAFQLERFLSGPSPVGIFVVAYHNGSPLRSIAALVNFSDAPSAPLIDIPATASVCAGARSFEPLLDWTTTA